VLHQLAGKPLLSHIVGTAQQLQPDKIIVVYGHGGDEVRSQLADLPVRWVEQKAQLGTGHAVMQAMPVVSAESRVLVLFGDVPLITADTLRQLISATPIDAIGVVTAHVSNPAGLGRILRNADGHMIAVVEEKDATSTQKHIQEINTGILIAPARDLSRWLPALNNNNAQGEYYYPDIIKMAVNEKITIHTVSVTQTEEGQGINDRAQLAQLERFYQQKQAWQLMLAGVTLLDPTRFDLRGSAHIAADVTIDVNVILEGNITIGSNSYIGANTLLRNVNIGENVTIKAHTVIEDATIENDCEVGPFARIRPGTHLKRGVHVGNFAEVKKSIVGAGSKINHVSYTGDAIIGEKVNIRAGVITCNYDGVNKHQTTIGDHAFIGSNASLIAPVTIANHATIGAGSTIKRNVPENALAVTRGEQRIIENWSRIIAKDEKK